MTGMQWDERQFLELTGGKELTPHEKYLLGRDTPAPYVEPKKPAAPAEPPVFDYQMKRFAAASSVIGGTISVCIAASQGAFTAAVAIGGQVLAVGGAAGIVWVILKAALAWKPSKQETNNQPPPGNSGEWEFYQEQRQGWRKKQ